MATELTVAIRAANEWNVLRENYLSIANYKDIIAIFPGLERFRTPKGFDSKFLLAMACLYECKQRSAWQLGLKWLLNLMNDKARREKLRDLYSFSDIELIRVTGQFDVFDTNELVEREREIGCLQGEIGWLQGEIGYLQGEINALFNSTSWKVTEPLRGARRYFRKIRRLSFKRGVTTPGTECYRATITAVPEGKRPRVVHVIGNFLTGGSSRLVVDLFEHLGHRYEQEVVTQYNPYPPNYTGIPIHEFKTRQMHEFIVYLSRFQPELVHIHYWGDKPWYAAMINACSEFGCKVIENINTPVAPYIDVCVSRYVYVSNYVKYTFGKKMVGKNLTIYPGSNFQMFVRDASQSTPDDCIGMVYRLEADKLNKKSIDVFIKVVQKRSQTRAIIVGGGSFLEPYKDTVKAHRVENAFNFTGFVSYEKLPEFYAQMSLFVAPVWKESFGQVSPFAMSMGIPVVGYNVGALAEILGDNSLLVPHGDSDALAEIIVRLLDDKERRVQIGQQNRVRAHGLFSVENMIRSYAKLYQELIGNKK